MPNWCFTNYVCKGNVKPLFNIMQELENLEEPLEPNGFGKTWLGCLVTKLGGDNTTIRCRGSWDSLLLDNDETLLFTTETAWAEANEVRELIEKTYPDLKMYYLSEEEGMGIFESNDLEAEYFTEHYKLWMDKDDGDLETFYINTLEELLGIVKRETGIIDVRNVDDCKKALHKKFDDYNLTTLFRHL